VVTLVVFSTEQLFVLVAAPARWRDDQGSAAAAAPPLAPAASAHDTHALLEPRRLWRAPWRDVVACTIAPRPGGGGAGGGGGARVTLRRAYSDASDVADKLASVAISYVTRSC